MRFNTDRLTASQTGKQTDIDGQTDGGTDRQIDRHLNAHTHIHSHRQTEKRADTQTDKHYTPYIGLGVSGVFLQCQSTKVRLQSDQPIILDMLSGLDSSAGYWSARPIATHGTMTSGPKGKGK